MSDSLTLRWAARTVSGTRKPTNDDSWLVFGSSASGALPFREEGNSNLDNYDLVFAVSDGMGGGNAGDLASRTLLNEMSRIIPETFKAAAHGFYPDYLEHLTSAIRHIHERINTAAQQDEAHNGMAATLALAWFTPENLYIANAGDSRMYRLREGQLEQLSKDHTFAWAQWKRGQMNEFQFRSHPRRSALYEVVGGNHQGVNPYLTATSYQAGDIFLLCTDGVIDGLWERHLSEALAACTNPAETADAILSRAISNAGLDDTTLIIIGVARSSAPQGE